MSRSSRTNASFIKDTLHLFEDRKQTAGFCQLMLPAEGHLAAKEAPPCCTKCLGSISWGGNSASRPKRQRAKAGWQPPGLCQSALPAPRRLIDRSRTGLLRLRCDSLPSRKADGWPSGRRHSPAKRVWVKSPSRVRIPLHPPFLSCVVAQHATAIRSCRPTRTRHSRGGARPVRLDLEIAVQALDCAGEAGAVVAVVQRDDGEVRFRQPHRSRADAAAMLRKGALSARSARAGSSSRRRRPPGPARTD